MPVIKRIVVLLILIGLGTAVWDYFDKDNFGISYRTATVKRGDIREVVSASGTLNPLKTVTVGSQVSGQIKSILVKVNDRVKAEQLLIEVDPSLILSQIKQDETNLANVERAFNQSKRDLQRTRELASKDYIPKVDLERAELAFLNVKYGLEAAKIALERDHLSLGYTRITAPIDGTIISLDVTEGQTLQSNYQAPTLMTIAADLTQMKIQVNIPESDIRKVRKDMEAVFTVSAFPDKEFLGVIDSISMSPAKAESGVAYTVNILADNKDLLLLPGMTANVGIVLSEKKDVLRVPSTALRFTPPIQEVKGIDKLLQYVNGAKTDASQVNAPANAKTIYLLRNDVPVPVSVTVGVSDDIYTEVSGEGVAEGDSVITGIKKARRP